MLGMRVLVERGLNSGCEAPEDEAGAAVRGRIRKDGEQLPPLAPLMIQVVREQALLLSRDERLDHGGARDDELAGLGSSVSRLRVNLEIDRFVLPGGHGRLLAGTGP